MRVAQVLDTLQCGGVQTMVAALCHSLREEDVCCSLVVMRHSISQKEETALLRSVEADVHFVSVTSNPVLLLSRCATIKRIFAEIHPDIVHCHSPMPHTYAALAAHSLRIPVVATVHNTVLWPNFGHRIRAQLALRLLVDHTTSRYVAICGQAKKNFTDLVPRSQDRFEIINNAIDFRRFWKVDQHSGRGEIRRELGIPDSAFVFANVATMDVRRKNQLKLVEAFSRTMLKAGNSHLVLVGDGADFERVARLVSALNLSANIHLVGYRTNIAEILREADCFIMPSLIEGVPIALLEAMWLQVPVLVGAVGGMREVIEDGVNGFTTVPTSTEAIEASMLRVINCPRTYLAEVVKKARRLISENFSPQACAREHRKLYERVLKERGAGDFPD